MPLPDAFADLIEALEEDGFMVIPKAGPSPEQERELVPLLVGHGHLTCPKCRTIYDPAQAVRKPLAWRSDCGHVIEEPCHWCAQDKAAREVKP